MTAITLTAHGDDLRQALRHANRVLDMIEDDPTGDHYDSGGEQGNASATVHGPAVERKP